MSKRLIVFLSVITVVTGLAGCAFMTGNRGTSVCPPGEEASREYTQNKTRKLVCMKVEGAENAENR